jgi:glycosyltransferase involved in cell wall biosynthesis
MTVATNLAQEMSDRGHQVVIAAAYSRFGRRPEHIDGVPALLRPAIRVVPRTGFSGLTSYRLLTAVARQARSFDVVHVHMSRDLVTLPIAALALLRGRPVVLQCHGMIDDSPLLLSRLLDALAVRPVMRRAAAILYLSPREAADVRHVLRSDHPQLIELANGVPLSRVQEKRDESLVVFAARLHARKRPRIFVEAAAQLRRAGVNARFVVAGPDEGELPNITRCIDELQLGGDVEYVGALGHADLLHLLARAAVYVLPSVDEPYPMTVLEALALGTPAVVTDSCGLADKLRETGAGVVTDGSALEVASAIRQLLEDPSAGVAATRAASEQFSMRPVVDRLETVYSDVING